LIPLLKKKEERRRKKRIIRGMTPCPKGTAKKGTAKKGTNKTISQWMNQHNM